MSKHDDLVIFVKKTFIRLVHHVDEMIEIVKLLLPTANAGKTALLVAIIILLTSWIGICVYYFWGRENLPQILK